VSCWSTAGSPTPSKHRPQIAGCVSLRVVKTRAEREPLLAFLHSYVDDTEEGFRRAMEAGANVLVGAGVAVETVVLILWGWFARPSSDGGSCSPTTRRPDSMHSVQEAVAHGP
jgi:hypothetical protein